MVRYCLDKREIHKAFPVYSEDVADLYLKSPNRDLIFKHSNKNKKSWQNFLYANWLSKIPRKRKTAGD